jgi:uncharacterized repeat protein (TIGR01451 family)
MKQIAVLLVVSTLMGTVGTTDARAAARPTRTPLGDYDPRLTKPNPAPVPETAVAGLKARVPDLQVSVDRVLGAPASFSSRAGFLTGPGGTGLGVQPAFRARFGDRANDPHAVIKAFLDEHAGLVGYGSEALAPGAAVVSRDYVTTNSNLRTVVWEQHLDGIQVFGAIVMGHITAREELANLTTLFVPQPKDAADRSYREGRARVIASPRVSATEALALAAANVGAQVAVSNLTAAGAAQGAGQLQKFKPAAGLKGETDVRLVWLPLSGSSLRLCWQVIFTSAAQSQMFRTLVDVQTGEVLLRRSLTRYLSDFSYRVYTSDSPSPFSPGWPTPNATQPPVVPRVLVTTNAFNLTASPLGWLDDNATTTQGNNVDAFADWDADSMPDLPRVTCVNRVFDFPLNLAQDPTNYTAASVVQSFYMLNRYHDFLYELGFTEAAGNFQTVNFGRGGLEGDAIRAAVQTGYDLNNAYMSTPPDGIAPDMVTLIWNGPNPRRDSTLDSEVIIHENTHGVTERTLGGGVGVNYIAQSGGIHEGNSDFFAHCYLSEAPDDVNGAYASAAYICYQLTYVNFHENYYYGGRCYPYCTDMQKNPLTFKDIDPYQILAHAGVPLSPLFTPFDPTFADEVHEVGEVWCVTLVDMWANLVTKHGWRIGNRLALQLVYDGERLSVPNPNFLELRDAILLADRVDNGGANQNEIWAAFAKRGMGGSASSPPGDTCVGVIEAFDMPGVAVVYALTDDSATGNGNGAIDPNECNDLYLYIRNSGQVTVSNIVATLSTTNTNVVIIQAQAAFANLPPGETGTNLTPFRIYTLPTFPCGSLIPLAVGFTAGGQVHTNYIQLRSGNLALKPVSFTNSIPLAIPDFDTLGIDSIINVSGLTAPIGRVKVSLHILHTAVGDLTLELISPTGTRVTLADGRGGVGNNYGLDCAAASWTTFDDGAATAITSGTAPFVGTFRPEQPLSVYNGRSGSAANGAWHLHVVDNFPLDFGTIRCWSLSFQETTCTDGDGPCAADLAVQAVATPAPVVLGNNLTYTITITNNKPLAAAGAVLTNLLPANVAFVAAAVSQGTWNNLGGRLVFNLGSVPNGTPVQATVVVTPLVTGPLTNRFGVSTASGDVNPANNLAIVTSTVILPAPDVIAGTTQLTAESNLPRNFGVDPGETVTVLFGLKNVGSLATTNLVATLVSGNGVLSNSPSQLYGAIPPFGQTTVFRPFSFTAQGAPGSVVTASLVLSDGLAPLNTIAFNFVLSGSATFANPAAITINDHAAATPYPAVINVSNVVGLISKVTVRLSKFAHAFPDDVEVLLVSPSGEKVILMSDAGGGTGVTNLVLTFDQSAASGLPDNGSLTSGTFQPTDFEPGDVFPGTIPAGAVSSSLDVLNGGNPNGAWRLYVADDTVVDAGVVVGGWSLTINTVSPPDPHADLSVGLVGSPGSVTIGQPVTYAIGVTNLGPDAASGVVLTNLLPAGMELLEATASQGTLSTNGGIVLANLGALAPSTNATVTLVARPLASGAKTVSAAVSADLLDLHWVNNTAAVVTEVTEAAADLAVRVTDAPDPVVQGQLLTYTITLTNQGPSAAPGVWLTNTLPAGDQVVSAIPSQGSVSSLGAGRVICDLGTLSTGATVVVTITARPLSAGLHTNRVEVASLAQDSNAANNRANAVTTVLVPGPAVVAAGFALVQEFGAVNGAIEPGEQVTLNLALRNSGTLDTANLVATLLATNGVILSAGPQSGGYGVLPAGGASVARPFTFRASATNGGVITAVLSLQAGAASLGTATFTLPLSTLQGFANPANILINDATVATPYPSTLTTSNLPPTVSQVTVTLHGFTHSFPSDVKMVLVGPGGQKVELMAYAGNGLPVSNLDLTFDDAGPALSASAALASGSYKPTSYSSGSSYPAPAPAGPYGSVLSALVNSPNGQWSLYITDDSGGDAGTISGGWSLGFVNAQPLTNSADLGVTSAVLPAPAPVGGPVTLTVTAVNYGPGAVTGVVLTNLLTPSLYVTQVSPSRGTFDRAGDVVTCSVGTLTNGETFTLTILGNPTIVGAMTNTAGASGTAPDPNPGNNTSGLTLAVSAPVVQVIHFGADLMITWPNLASGYILESSPTLGPAANWQPVPGDPLVYLGLNVVILSAPAEPNLFYRLAKP